MRRFWPLILVFVLISALSFSLVVVGSGLQLALRATAAAESNWAKQLHEAVFHLDRYAETGDPAERAEYLERLRFVEGYGELRELVAAGRLDEATRASAQMERAGNAPEDVALILKTAHRYRNFAFLQQALAQWARADAIVAEIAALGRRIEAAAPDAREPLRAQLVDLRGALRPAADTLAQNLGSTAHTLRTTVFWLALLSALSLAALGILLTWAGLRRIAESEQRFRHLLNTANDGIAAVDPVSGTILGSNHRLAEMTGYSEAELGGTPYPQLFASEERERLSDSDGRILDGIMQLHLRARDGRETPVEVSARYTLWSDDEALIVIVRDVTERRAHERRIEYLASHDPLTGLVNRREFERGAEALLAERRGRGHALLYMDLDQFKVVNDTCGHAAGDELLRQLTSRLRHSIRDSDTLARLGGDEFGVLLVDCTLAQAEQIAVKMINTVNGWRFEWGERRFSVGASIGVVPLGIGGGGLATMLSAADAACYAAKEAGRNRVIVYRPGDTALLARQGEMDWVARLTAALSEDRFELYCQRIVSAREARPGEGQHWELLVRLRERDGTLVEPGHFLPAAERFNLVAAVDRRVVERAFAGIRDALEQGASSRDVYAINLSGGTISDPDFGVFVQQAFDRSGVPPTMTCFEITETAAIGNMDAAQVFITRMHELGSQIALDDFGTGMSSFAYLRNLSVDYLKIDGSFVRDLPTDQVSTAMVRAIYELSRAIGVRTVAEFVETDAAFRHVKALGGDLAQGFALHRPEPWRWDPRSDPEVALVGSSPTLTE